MVSIGPSVGVHLAGWKGDPAHRWPGRQIIAVLAFLLMDRLYEAHPDPWINHGLRTDEGGRWWHRYRDPAPERNVHNRPPAE